MPTKKRKGTLAKGKRKKTTKKRRKTTMRKKSKYKTLDEVFRNTEESVMEIEHVPEEEIVKVVKGVMDIFFNIWIRFAVDLEKELKMSPWQWDFAIYDGHKKWRFKDEFNFGAVREVLLKDDSFPYIQSLRAEILPIGKKMYLKISFLFQEGRKYEGTETIVANVSYQIYASPIRQISMRKVKNSLQDIVKVWVEAQIKKDYSLLWDYCKEKLIRGRA